MKGLEHRLNYLNYDPNNQMHQKFPEDTSIECLADIQLNILRYLNVKKLKTLSNRE